MYSSSCSFNDVSNKNRQKVNKNVCVCMKVEIGRNITLVSLLICCLVKKRFHSINFFFLFLVFSGKKKQKNDRKKQLLYV